MNMKIKKINYNDHLKEIMERLPRGFFLTSQNSGKINTMTIGWGSIAYIWNKPIFIITVRDSRLSYNIIKKSNNFTISVPYVSKMKEELSFCGSKSGRNYNKFEECNLDICPGEKINTPVIKGCQYYYECEIIYKQKMNINLLEKKSKKIWYKDNDLHTFFYGEIINSYKNNK